MTGEKYLAAAYLVVLIALLGYVLIIALKLDRLKRELGDLESLATTGAEAGEPPKLQVTVGDSADRAPPTA